MVEIYFMMGAIGLLMLLVAFALNEFGFLQTKSSFYNIFNAIGAFLLAIYALYIGSMIFLVLEILWGVFALIKLSLSIGKPRS